MGKKKRNKAQRNASAKATNRSVLPKQPSKTVTVEVQAPKSRYKSSAKQRGTVTPDAIRRAMQAAMEGRPAKLFAILAYFLKIDDEIPSALRSVIDAVTADTITYRHLEESEAADHQEAYLKAVFKRLKIVRLFRALLKGHYFGVSAAGLIEGGLEVDGRSYYGPVRYQMVPRDWIYAAKRERTDSHTTLYVGHQPLADYRPGQVLFYSADELPELEDVDFSALGCGVGASRFACFSYFNVEDWAMLNEAFGQPRVIGTLLQGWGKDDKAMIEQAVAEYGSDSRIVITERTKLETQEGKGDPDAFDHFRMACQEARSNLVKGEAVTGAQTKYGTNAASKTANGIRLDVSRGLARTLTEMLQEDISEPWLLYNFGEVLVEPVVRVQAARDRLGTAKVYAEAAKLIPVSRTQMRADLSLQEPTGDDDAVGGTRTANPLDLLGTFP